MGLKPTLLIVEENAQRMLVYQALFNDGYNVVYYATMPDIVLANMAVKHTEELAQRHPDVPVCYVNGTSDHEIPMVEHRCVLPATARLSELENAVEKLLKKHTTFK